MPDFRWLAMELALHSDRPFSSVKSMTLRIDRLRKRIRLSGEFRSEHVDQVKAEMDECGSRSVVDIEEVDLVSVLNASPYIRAWMAQERERPAH